MQNRVKVARQICESATVAVLWASILFCLWEIFGFKQSYTGPFEENSESYQSAASRYYSGFDFSIANDELASALHNLIKKSNVLERAEITKAFQETDQSDLCRSGEIKDIYSGQCWRADARCGSTAPTAEGQCYNREHIWPQSWYICKHGFPCCASTHRRFFS